MSKVIRVVPVPAVDGAASKATGTAVYVGDERIRVQKLTLIAEPHNVWRAIIETTVQLDGEIAAALPPASEGPHWIEVTSVDDKGKQTYIDEITGDQLTIERRSETCVTGKVIEVEERRLYRALPARPPEPPEPPAPPPSRLICDCCGDVTHKPHGWLCRAMAAIDRWTGMHKDSGGKT